LPNAHIVGHSYGGYTALILSLKNPDLVRTLTLAEPPIASWLADLPGDTSEDGMALLTKLMSQFIEPVKLAFESDDEEMALRKFLDFVGGKGTLDRLPKSVEEMCRRNIKELKALMISEDRYPYIDREQVRRLNLPTLILSGGMSQDVAKLTDSELERLIPERLQKRVVLNGATHLMWTEQPEQSRMSVLEFIHGK
jgi:non-heme chloroperoxidase